MKNIITIEDWFSFNTQSTLFLRHRHTFHHHYKSPVTLYLWWEQSSSIERITRKATKDSVEKLWVFLELEQVMHDFKIGFKLLTVVLWFLCSESFIMVLDVACLLTDQRTAKLHCQWGFYCKRRRAAHRKNMNWSSDKYKH